MKSKFKQEPNQTVEIDKMKRPVQEDKEKKSRDSTVYGKPFDHNEWLGVLTSSGLFV